MLPKVEALLSRSVVEVELPTRTYRLHMEGESITGYADEIEAMRQAVYLILSVERYRHEIYSWNYGVELEALIGQPLSFVLPEAKRRLREALMQDTRITGVDDFNFEVEREKVLCTFSVHTVFGDMKAERMVDL